MEVLYKVDKWASSEDDILLIEVTKQTDKTVWYGHDGREIKELKSSKYYQYFTSKTDAISLIDSRNERKKLSRDIERIRDAAPVLLEALIEARFYVKMALDNCYNPVAEKKLEKIDGAIAAARGE